MLGRACLMLIRIRVEQRSVMDLLDGLLRLAGVDGRLDTRCDLSASWTLSVAKSDRDEMPFHVLAQGSARVLIPGQPDALLHSGDVLILVGASSHRLEGIDATDGALLCGRFLLPAGAARLMRSLLPSVLVVAGAAPGTDPALATLLRLLRAETDAPGAGSAAVLQHFCAALFALCLRGALKGSAVTQGLLALSRHPRLAELASGIVQRPGEAWTLEDMARRANWSRSSLIRAFQAATGISPAAFLVQVRMTEASRLLRESQGSVDGVGEAVGYASAAAFQRAFKRETGFTPAEWRLAPQLGEPLSRPQRVRLPEP